MSCVSMLIDCLEEIRTAEYSSQSNVLKIYAKADEILGLIFRIGKQKDSFEEEDRRKIGALMVHALQPIKFSIEYTACKSRTRLETGTLKRRSALQFLVDDYSQFPVESTTLSTKFADAYLHESIELLDDIIDKWHDEQDSDEGCSDREGHADDLPPSHTWWFL
eukprot:jgi/Antlo1/1252/2316